MELRAGKIVNGSVVLDDEEELEEGAPVAVLVGEPESEVSVSSDELSEIRAGLKEANRGELLDARAFVRELRGEG